MAGIPMGVLTDQLFAVFNSKVKRLSASKALNEYLMFEVVSTHLLGTALGIESLVYIDVVDGSVYGGRFQAIFASRSRSVY